MFNYRDKVFSHQLSTKADKLTGAAGDLMREDDNRPVSVTHTTVLVLELSKFQLCT